MESADPLEKWMKIKRRKHAKNSSFLCLCYISRAVRAGRCRERRYADHIFIQIYFRMHYFVDKFSKFSSPQAASGHRPPSQNPADVPAQIPRSAVEKLSKKSSVRIYIARVTMSEFRFLSVPAGFFCSHLVGITLKIVCM